jgi:syntaxin 5
MRQRKATTTTTTPNNNNTDYDMQVQLQEQQQRRDTRNRLQHARQAESTLAELGTLFGKMSSLISQQGEVLEKVEDDVEAALLDVSAGESEIQTLYTIKKGNRGLILKVFGILIFLIIFMRFY